MNATTQRPDLRAALVRVDGVSLVARYGRERAFADAAGCVADSEREFIAGR